MVTFQATSTGEEELNRSGNLYGRCWMPEWIGSLLFLSSVGLTGVKIAEDFGNRGLRGYAMLLLLILVYATAIAVAFI